MDSSSIKVKSNRMVKSKTLLLCIVFLFFSQMMSSAQVTASVFAPSSTEQQTTVSVDFKKVPLAEALQTLARKVNVGISYETLIVPAKRVTYRAENTSIFKILDNILKNTGLQSTLSQDRKVIMIKEKPVVLTQKQETVSGTVTDAGTGDTLPGVNIKVKGTATGTSTGAEGQYELTVESLQDTLVFSYVGYETKEMPIQGRTNLSISLKPSTQSLEEVVVSGLASTIKTENAAHSISKVNADELMGGTIPTTASEALAGKVAGVNITSTGGAPGGGMDFKLRGISTLGAGSSQPLIIVDGVYIDNSSLQNGLGSVSGVDQANQSDNANRLADLNPGDIESIQILKGPSAAAIYGARANAGVVIIKTQRGQAGRTQVSFRQDAGFASILHKKSQPSWSKSKIDQVYGSGTNKAKVAKDLLDNNMHDYQDLLFGNKGALINDQLKVSGGNEKTKFLISGAIKRNNGIIKNTGFNRYSLRANLDHHFGKDITIHSSTNYINSQTQRGWSGNGGVGSVTYALAYTPPFAQLLPDEKGNYPSNPFYQMNPLELVKYGVNKEDVNRLLQSEELNVGIFQAGGYKLDLKLNGSVDFLQGNSLVNQPAFLQYQANQTNPGHVVASGYKNLNIHLNAFLVYNMTLGSEEKSWNLTTQLGYTTFHKGLERQQVEGRGFLEGQTNVKTSAIQEVRDDYVEKVTDVGYVGQQKINWENKIIGTIGVRFDKSTLNRNEGKYYFFPKGSAAINLTNFDFWKKNIFNRVKLRAAYGETGGLPNFGVTFSKLNTGNISGSVGTFLSTRTVDPDLKPETAKEIEFGADIGLLDNRISLSATYYKKDVDDLILDKRLPGSSGLQVQATNAANLTNRGVELSLSFIPIQNKHFTWNSIFNWAKNNSKITKLKVPSYTTGAFGASLGAYYIAEGFSPTTIIGTPYNEKKGHYTVYGDGQPDFILSSNNSIGLFNNWKLSFLWLFKYGQDDIAIIRLLEDQNGTTPDWNEDYNGNGKPNGIDRKESGAGPYVKDATYLKLKQISLYYSIPNKFLNKFTGNSVKGARLGVSGNNVLLFTSYPGYDPEASEFGAQAINTGVSVAPYPSSRKIMFHIKFNF